MNRATGGGTPMLSRAAAFACLCTLATLPGIAHAQDVLLREMEPQTDGLEWSAWVSDVPVVDLTGLWRFVESSSDPMVTVWEGREIRYEISQQTNRVVLSLRPENGEPMVQEYLWNGSVNSFEKGGTEVRERAHWRDGGRTLEVEGRRWPADDRSKLVKYTMSYRLEAPRRLVLRLTDEHGETVWRFER